MQRWYGVDLADLYRGRMSYRRLGVLLAKLPQDSWVQTEMRDEMPAVVQEESGPERFGPWALINYQLAGITDALARLEYVQAIAGSLEPKPDLPKLSPRPGLPTVRLLRTPAQISYLQGLRSKGA